MKRLRTSRQVSLLCTGSRTSLSALTHESFTDCTGAFGFVQLARNKNNGQLVAIKFLERGPDKVGYCFCLHPAQSKLEWHRSSLLSKL